MPPGETSSSPQVIQDSVPTAVSDEKCAPRDPSELNGDLGGLPPRLTSLFDQSCFFPLLLTDVDPRKHLTQGPSPCLLPDDPPAAVETCLAPLILQDTVWNPPPRKPLRISTSTTRLRAQQATPGGLLLCLMPPSSTHDTQG